MVAFAIWEPLDFVVVSTNAKVAIHLGVKLVNIRSMASSTPMYEQNR